MEGSDAPLVQRRRGSGGGGSGTSGRGSVGAAGLSAASPATGQQQLLRVRVELVRAIDILGGAEGSASDVRGETLALCMLRALNELAASLQERYTSHVTVEQLGERSSERRDASDTASALSGLESSALHNTLDVAVIEEQPGVNVRNCHGGAGMAHSLKMNNLSYVMLTWLLEHTPRLAPLAFFRSTHRKEVVMRCLPDSVHRAPDPKRRAGDGDDLLASEDRASAAAAIAARAEKAAAAAASVAAAAAAGSAGSDPSSHATPAPLQPAPAAYGTKAHDLNKDISVATLRRCLMSADPIPFALKPALKRSFRHRFPSMAAAPESVLFEDACGALAATARGKVDDMCDSVWLALAVALERMALAEPPSYVERGVAERTLLLSPPTPETLRAGTRVLAFDVGVRNLALAVVHVSIW